VISPPAARDDADGVASIPSGVEDRIEQTNASLTSLERRVADASLEPTIGPQERAVLTSLALAVDHMVRELEAIVAAPVSAAQADGRRFGRRVGRRDPASRGANGADAAMDLRDEYLEDATARVRALRARLEEASGTVLVLAGQPPRQAPRRARPGWLFAGRLPSSPAAVDAAATATVAAARPAARRSSMARLAFAGKVCTIVGLCLAVFFAYEYLVTPLEMSRAQRFLLTEFKQAQADGSLDRTPLATGGPVALLQIPRLGLDRVVVEGTGQQSMKSGPGHLPGSSLPGQFGNAVIGAHRTTYGGPFRNLNELHAGDPVLVTSGLGAFTYRVEHVLVVKPGQPDPIGPTLDSRLTLFTSDPAFTAKDRLVVIAMLSGDPAQFNREPSQPVPPNDLGTSGDPVGLLVALLAGAALAGLIWAWRRYRGLWPTVATYLAFVPIAMALAWVTCGGLDRVLPSTI